MTHFFNNKHVLVENVSFQDPIYTIYNCKEVGAFASCTPHRTSRIAVSNVGLVKISDTHIYVKGLDAFEGSPVLDIKAAKKEEKIS